jgi:hypothetical protein
MFMFFPFQFKCSSGSELRRATVYSKHLRYQTGSPWLDCKLLIMSKLYCDRRRRSAEALPFVDIFAQDSSLVTSLRTFLQTYFGMDLYSLEFL